MLVMLIFVLSTTLIWIVKYQTKWFSMKLHEGGMHMSPPFHISLTEHSPVCWHTTKADSLVGMTFELTSEGRKTPGRIHVYVLRTNHKVAYDPPSIP